MISNKNKISIALILAALSGMLLHPNNNWLTKLLALIPCVVACHIIEPITKEENECDK